MAGRDGAFDYRFISAVLRVRRMDMREIMRFTATGGVSAGVYAVVLAFLLHQTAAHTAAAAAYVAAMCVNYLMQRVWTFRSMRRHREALPRYLVTHAGGILLNSTILHICVDLQNYPILPVQVGALMLVAAWSFLLQKAWVFHSKANP